MAARRKVRGREAQLSFEALAIEGGLLSADWLGRVAQLQADGQSAPQYRIPKGLNLRDEIGRYWRIAQANWTDFAKGRNARGDGQALADQFVHALLRGSFGFESLEQVDAIALADRIFPVGTVALGGRVPVVVGPAGSGLDTPSSAFGDGTRRRSAFGLAQEFLNASDNALWAIASDGIVLRILRDNASLTRPAWIEADLGRIFTEERYADFAALWLLVHETRFGAKDRPPSDCSLETWRSAGREEGTRAREQLRKGVEEALVALGDGFVAHPDNSELRASLTSGAVTKDAFFQELLRLVYRVIFLLTAEERSVLHAPAASDAARKLYADGYGMRRLRDRSARRNAYDRFGDLWEAMKIVLRGLSRGEARLGLPALGGLFDDGQCLHLDAAKLENRALLHAVFRLSWLREDGSLSRVNWRDMGPEELGSVYEGLLELVPQITDGGRKFAFATGAETKGNARKMTGSYYTPDSLVQVLLDSALEPVVQDTIAKNPEKPTSALLDLSIVDPACGSGHFLLSAARRLAAHVARIEANGTPSADQYRHALRQVVGRCIFGVDLNPMAVELCKVSLWMEAVEPGRPLSFLDSHIQHGNALLGATPELLANGIPDAAWEPLEGDDKKVASALKKQNKKERVELSLNLASPPASTYARIGAGARAVDDAGDDSLDAVMGKEKDWRELVDSAAYRHQRFVADLWCAAFVWQKAPGPLRELAPTESTFRAVHKEAGRASKALRDEVDRLRELFQFFHWYLAFPQVTAKGGFDVVLGNPPWERVKLQEQEFFASRSGEIAGAANAAARKKLIAKLPEANPQLWAEWSLASRKSDGESHIIRQSGRYPLCGKGDVNTYAIFAEHDRALLRPTGALGCILPAGIATDDTTKEYFQSIVRSGSLRAIYHFENEERVFVGVNNMFRFVLLSLTGLETRSATAEVVAFARNRDDVLDPARRYRLTAAEIAAINPNTGTFPTFFSRRDADINFALYRRAGILWREADEANGNPWGLRFIRMFDMANDSGLFRTRAELETARGSLKGNHIVSNGGEHLPLMEAKMVHHFDHRFATYEGATQANLNKGTLPHSSAAQHLDPEYGPTPEYWVAATEVAERLRDRWSRAWLMGWRDITNAHNERTVIASLSPRVAVGHKLPLMFPATEPALVACLCASLSSFVLDYAARQKLGGTSLTYFIVKQLPVLAPSTYAADTEWQLGSPVRDFILPRVLELAYTAWDLEPFGRDVGYDGPPFRWEPERRFFLRSELDAAFFHLYGLSRDDTDYVMDTFPIVRKNDEKAHGVYRTKRVVLEIYDAMAKAAHSGKPYATRLGPPPADPRVAHPPRAAGAQKRTRG